MSSRRQKRPRVCVLGLRGLPGVMGGVETHCEALYPRLVKLIDAEFIVLGRSGYAASQNYQGVRVTPIWAPRSKYLEAIVHTLIGLFYARWFLGARIVHIHAIGPGVLSPLARLLGMRVIVTHHGCDYARAKWNGFARGVLRLGEWLSVHAADRVIVVSMNVAVALRQQYPHAAHRIVHIPNGADASAAGVSGDHELLHTLGLVDERYVLAVGRLVPEKGFHELITAFRDSHINAKLVIAGGADHEDSYARMLMQQRCDDIIFTGRVGRAELNALYSNASLFVLPSHHEGLAIAALEAVAAGAPILVSDIAANKDLELDEVNYFPVGRIDALKLKLSRPHKSYRVNRERLLSRFDWSVIAEESRAVYAGVTPPRSGAASPASGVAA